MTAPLSASAESVPPPPMNRSRRIDVVDALRGFALAGILLIHSLERSNVCQNPDQPLGFLTFLDGPLGDMIYPIFSGKSYAIFSMLFGFSFWVQFERMKAKGHDIGGRFAWRLCLLFGFGILHTLYYVGDLLMLYAVFGFLLLPVRKAPDWLILTGAIVLLVLPLQLVEVVRILMNPEYTPLKMGNSWQYWSAVIPVEANGSYLEVLHAHFTVGWKANLLWNWEAGRGFHIPGLFLLGMLAARRKAFTEMRKRWWLVVCLLSLAASIGLGEAASATKLHFANGGNLHDVLMNLIKPSADLFQMLLMVSAFILLWRVKIGERLFGFLIPYGRMSLTNYMLPGLFGILIYNACGLGLWHYLGNTLCILTGLVILAFQIVFSRWCLKRFGQGPMEKLWRWLMWIGSEENKRPKTA
jgi:uncharacterized protein